MIGTDCELEIHELCRRIDELGDRVGELWHDAAAAGDFVELERCTSAAQALRRAAIALRADSMIGV